MADRKPTDSIEEAEFSCAPADPDAFKEVFLRYGKPILSFVFSLVGDGALAEELTQETFIRAYRGLGSMKKETRISTWLFGIARNVVREAIRNRYRDRRRTVLDDGVRTSLIDLRSGPAEQLISGELSRTIRRALACLPQDYRLVFVLKVVHQMRYEEISAITGASVGKLKSDLHRARAEMRHRLLPYLGKDAFGIRGAQ